MTLFKEIYLKNRPKLIIALSTILILMAVIELYFALFVKVSSNDECLWEHKNAGKGKTKIVINLVKVGGVAWNAGIRNGDELLEINHVLLPNTGIAQAVLDSVKAGDFADYTIKKNGEIINTKVYVKKLVNIGNVASVIFALIQILIGFIVLLAKPDGRVQKLFYGIGVAEVLASSFVFISNKITPELVHANPYPVYLFAVLAITGICSVPFLFLAFFWTFPKPFKILDNKWVKRLFIILPVLFFIFLFSLAVATLSFNFAYLDTFKQVNKYQRHIFFRFANYCLYIFNN